VFVDGCVLSPHVMLLHVACQTACPTLTLKRGIPLGAFRDYDAGGRTNDVGAEVWRKFRGNFRHDWLLEKGGEALSENSDYFTAFLPPVRSVSLQVSVFREMNSMHEVRARTTNI
jgi:hypothetical protein